VSGLASPNVLGIEDGGFDDQSGVDLLVLYRMSVGAVVGVAVGAQG
jgi:hypothetical protein